MQPSDFAATRSEVGASCQLANSRPFDAFEVESAAQEVVRQVREVDSVPEEMPLNRPARTPRGQAAVSARIDILPAAVIHR